MISYKDNKTSLFNLNVTFQALADLDELIKYYSVDKPGPAYVTVDYPAPATKLQIDRKAFTALLIAQRDRLVKYLAALGIDYDN